jgi:hypothetical protein
VITDLPSLLKNQRYRENDDVEVPCASAGRTIAIAPGNCSVSALTGGRTPLKVLFAGLDPGLAGRDQISVQLAEQVPTCHGEAFMAWHVRQDRRRRVPPPKFRWSNLEGGWARLSLGKTGTYPEEGTPWKLPYV